VRHLLNDQVLTKDEILQLFELAKNLKEHRRRGKRFKLLEGKTLAMIFEKPSLRTRASFEVAMFELGGHASFLNSQDLQLGRGETVADTGRVLGRYYDAIMARVFDHKNLEILARYAGVPVINGLSDKFHPCQALTDIFTLWERGLDLGNIILVFVGDGNNNVTNSLMLICARLGIRFRVSCPLEYMPDERIIALAEIDKARSICPVQIMLDPKKAVGAADVIYADTWVSMGKEKEEKKRIKTLLPYQLNYELLSHAKKDALIMHCLPAHRGQEITDEVIDGPNSIVFDQAENRLHVEKAILTMFLKQFNMPSRT
jgi:ornithine carbamoyltransferase